MVLFSCHSLEAGLGIARGWCAQVHLNLGSLGVTNGSLPGIEGSLIELVASPTNRRNCASCLLVDLRNTSTSIDLPAHTTHFTSLLYAML